MAKIKRVERGTVLYVNGTELAVEPADGKQFTLEELQGFVGGYIENIHISEKTKIMYVDEDAKRKNLPYNRSATIRMDQRYNGQFVQGTALVVYRIDAPLEDKVKKVKKA